MTWSPVKRLLGQRPVQRLDAPRHGASGRLATAKLHPSDVMPLNGHERGDIGQRRACYGAPRGR